jgi:predicted  nucleic acid-binding Zn-ribbon protein
MSPNKVTSFEGSWDDYQHHLSLKVEEQNSSKESKTERTRRYRQQREEQAEAKKLKNALKDIENQIFDYEIKKATAEKKLSESESLNDIDISTYSKQYAKCEEQLEELMHQWEKISSEIEELA